MFISHRHSISLLTLEMSKQSKEEMKAGSTGSKRKYSWIVSSVSYNQSQTNFPVLEVSLRLKQLELCLKQQQIPSVSSYTLLDKLKKLKDI